MQESVEQQLVTCQEMFLEIQQKMDSLSALGPVSDLGPEPVPDLGPEPGPDLGPDLGLVVSQQEAAEMLFSKVKLLKQKLVSFQNLLQDKEEEETQQQQQQSQRPPQAELRRCSSSSVQEIFSSPRNKFLRQNSLQQQKELEQDLSEQRGLTQAIARLCSQESEELSLPSPWGPPAGPDVRAMDQEKKWAGLHSGFLSVEQLWLLPPSEVSDWWRRRRRSDGTAGRTIVPQSLIRRLQELGVRAEAESLDEVSRQTLDEDLFLVLHDVSLSLSSVKHLLDSPEREEDEDEETQLKLQQLQTLSAELLTLGGELSSQGSKVSAVLGSECVRRCVDDLSRVLPVVWASLSGRETQLKTLHQETVKHKRRLSELHAAFTSNQTTPPQITNNLSGTLGFNQQLQVVNETQTSLQLQATQVNSLLKDVQQGDLSSSSSSSSSTSTSLVHQVKQLQDDLDSSLRGVHCHREELRSSEELQRMFERLLLSLQELLTLGHERLTQQEEEEQSRSHLQQQLSSHTKFFQFLGHHCQTLHFLTCRLPESALHRWGSAVTDLQDEVTRLQQRGLERGSRMEERLQAWTQWEDDRSWTDSLLTELETSFPRMHQEEPECDQQFSEDLCSLQELSDVLAQNKARFSRTLEAGLRLQASGCRGVGVATGELQTCWRTLHLRVDSERITLNRTKKLRLRFFHDSALLSERMKKATELMNDWSHRISVSENQETDVGQRRELYLQSVTLTQEFEARSGLKVSVIGAGSQLVQLEKDGGSSDGSPDDTEKETSETLPHLCSILSRLRQTEDDWSALLSGLPVVQRALQKWWLEMLSQQEALLELQLWLGAAESQLQENLDQTSSTNAELRKLLKFCQQRRSELSAHQAVLDHVNLPLHTCGTDDDQAERYRHIEFAEDQGRLNRQWLSFQETLNSQIQILEQDFQTRAELECRLQQIDSWVTAQSLWMNSAQTPSSRTELQRSVDACQGLEEQIRLKAAALQELTDRVCGHSSSDFMSHIRRSMQTCAALPQQNDSLKRTLVRTLQLWDAAVQSLSEMRLKTARTSQALVHLGDSGLCLQAHRDQHAKLQRLHEDTAAVDAEWVELSRSVSSLTDVVSSEAAVLLTQQLDTQRHSWTDVSAALQRRLRRSLEVLQAWEVHAGLAAAFSQRLQMLQSDATSAVSCETTADDDGSEEQIAVRIQHLQNLLQNTHTLQSDLQGVLEASKALCLCLEPSATALVQSESRLLSRGVLQLSYMLTGKLGDLQEELQQLQEFTDVLQSLDTNVDVWQQSLDAVDHTADQSVLLEPSSLSADLDVLNELSCSLTLGDAAARHLRRLNCRWTTASARAQEACSELHTESLQQQSFQLKCQSWTCFLQTMEDSVAVDVAGSYLGLREQLRTHKRFEAELSTGHQILHSVITEALQLLHRGEVDDRSDFLLKLAQLREHWQGALQRANQRRSLVDGLVKHWHLYGRGLKKLRRFLCDARSLLPPSGPPSCSLRRLRRSLTDLQHTELLFQRHQSSFVHTLEVGRQLFSMADEETQTLLQEDLGTLQEEWDDLRGLLRHRLELTQDVVQKWEWCDAGLADSMLRLKEIKSRLNQSLPESDDELLSAEKFNMENEDSLVDWAQSLTELSTMKTDLSQYIIADDVLLLHEQVEHLRCQWEELCLKVSLRKQEIADRLNAWIIFNEKNKELCEWLTLMENKVENHSELNIEEMVEKLKKDCMEEINLFSENKTHLKQLGEQLITASNKTKETEINDKLKDVNDRWQHLFHHIEARVRKLKETLVTVQQLDKNMSNMRTWLCRVEAELAKPLVYDDCHGDEIQRKLTEQQDVQRDIEQRSESVASVLTLCDVLLHDADACGGSDCENDAVQQTSRSLERRWRNICAMSTERRMRIEETQRLWRKFLDDFSRFEDWLKNAELTASTPDSADVLYTNAKEELKKFEAFQRQVHERLTQLELVNKQYRRLARENRTDASCRLKVMVQQGNQRWDELQRRVSAVLRRLKHFTSQREDFEGTREGILVWLTEMDLQLTNVEHFSESDVEDKMRQLNGFQQEITLNTNKIDALIVFGENLIQKSAPLDAVLIEDELEELHSYCQEVFGRVARFHHRLVNRRPVLEEDQDLSDQDTDLDEHPDLTEGSAWREMRRRRKEEEEDVPAVGGVSGGRQVMCHLLAPPLERSGRETPVSVDSIPLEWDHTVDVGGSSHEEDDEDVTFFSALSVKSMTDTPSWHQPDSPHRKRLPRGSCSTPYHQQGYVKLMSECSGSINSVKRVKLMLNDEEEEPEEAGLTSSVAERHGSTGVIQRWELLQVQRVDAASDVSEDAVLWQKVNSDLCDVTSWLQQLLQELDELQRIPTSTDIRDVEENVRKLKVMQKTFSSYKRLMISVNINARHLPSSDSSDLQEALSVANAGWTQACVGVESWGWSLHTALMQCQEFHESLHSLLLWLAQAEKKLHAVNVSDAASGSDLLSHRDALMELQGDLRTRQRQVLSLQEISSQLLLEATSGDSVEAKEKVHVIGNKLRLLLRQTDAELHALQQRAEVTSSWCERDSVGVGRVNNELLLHKSEDVSQPEKRRTDSSPPPHRRPFLVRVLRAAFPLHLLFLVLLVLTCLVPVAEDDFSCTTSNNFARSFYPMLRYTNGPPPT